MPAYESDITQFLKRLKQSRPGLEDRQREGRSIWWDREPMDLERMRELKQSRVPAKAYPYQTES